ncbi:integrase [Pseudomonas sp. TE36184]|jgi:integrase
MAILQTIYFIPSLGSELTDFLLRTIPLRRQRKVARYLQHVDLWLRHTQYKSLSDSLLPLEAYVYFYLSHISVYPGPGKPAEPRNYYLPVHIDDLLINRKLKGLGRLSNRQAASRIAAVMRWQEHRFGINLDPLRSQMKKLYRQAAHFVRTPELTAHAKLYSGESLELVSDTCRGLDLWVRDLAMLRVLQETGCTTSDLAEARCADLICEGVDFWYLQFGNQKKAFLTDGTAMLLQVLLGRHHHWAAYRCNHDHLFSMGDAQVEFTMDAHEIDTVLERRYRFALMVTSVNCARAVDLYCHDATPFPKGFVSERTAVTTPDDAVTRVVNLQFAPEVDNGLTHRSSTALDDQYCYVDWDAAIRNSTMASDATKDRGLSGVPDPLSHVNFRNGRVFITEDDNDN